MKKAVLTAMQGSLQWIGLFILGISSFNAHSQCTPIPPNLVSWWPAENHAEDVIGANHGTIHNGTSYSVGMVNQTFTFDEVDDYILVEDDPTLDLTGDMTLEAWIRRTGFNSDVGVVIAKGGGYINGVDLPTVFQMRFNLLQFEALFEDSNGDNIILGGPSFEDGMFHHYVYVRSGNTHELFVDGFSFGNVAFTDGPSSTADLPMTIGAQYHMHQNSNDSISNFFGGDIDEIGLYNRALTQTEIQALYDAGADGKCTNNLSLLPPNPTLETISIYPNPTQTTTQITLPESMISLYTNLTITLFNTLGEKVLVTTINGSYTELDIEHLNNGLFYYSIADQSQTLTTGKLVKN